MSAFKRSARHFNVRSYTGSVVPAAPSFSSGFVADAGGSRREVSDDAGCPRSFLQPPCDAAQGWLVDTVHILYHYHGQV